MRMPSFKRAIGYAGLFSFGFLVAFVLLGYIGPVQFGKDAPAWVQAITSFFAILIAIYIPNRIARSEQKRQIEESRYRARSLAFVLRPSVESLLSRVDGTRKRWRLCPERFEDYEVAQPLELPQTISEHLLDLHILGEAGIAIQRAIFAVEQLRTAVYTEFANLYAGGVYIDPDDGEQIPLPEVGDMDELIAKTAAELERAREAINEFLV